MQRGDAARGFERDVDAELVILRRPFGVSPDQRGRGPVRDGHGRRAVEPETADREPGVAITGRRIERHVRAQRQGDLTAIGERIDGDDLIRSGQPS